MSSSFEKCRETLKERASVLFSSGELSDCNFIVGEKEVSIPAHKIFLAISSPVFYAMFFGDMAEKNESIPIKDLEPAAFKGMLEYIYTDTVVFESTSHACTVYIAAKKYLLPFLVSLCERFITENGEAAEACELYEFARFHDIDSIEQACLNLFRTETSEVLVSQTFLEAEFSTVQALVDQDVLNVTSELELFRAVELWAYKESERQGVTVEQLAPKMGDVVSKLRLLSLSPDEFATAPALSSLLTTDERLAIAMNITRPGTLPYPERLSRVTVPRRPVPVPEPFEEEWSLRRDCEDNPALFSITKWSNPFPRKGIKVSRQIKIRGIKISAQKKTLVEGESTSYEEKVTVVLKKDWALKFNGALYQSETPYNGEMLIKFHKPVLIEPDRLYWLIVQYDKPGTYLFTKDIRSRYSTHNIDIDLSVDFSSITELLFTDIPPKVTSTALTPTSVVASV